MGLSSRALYDRVCRILRWENRPPTRYISTKSIVIYSSILTNIIHPRDGSIVGIYTPGEYDLTTTFKMDKTTHDCMILSKLYPAFTFLALASTNCVAYTTARNGAMADFHQLSVYRPVRFGSLSSLVPVLVVTRGTCEWYAVSVTLSNNTWHVDSVTKCYGSN